MVFELIASGRSGEHAGLRLCEHRRYRIGRDPTADLCPAWDRYCSAEHATLRLDAGQVHVRRLPEAGNPIYFCGEACDSFLLGPGDQFVIGETRFRLVGDHAEVTPSQDPSLEEVVFQRSKLQQIRFTDADRRIDVLVRLPDVIAAARNEHDRDAQLVSILLAGIRHAEAAAVVKLGPEGVETGAWERRRETAGAMRTSSRLVAEAITRGETVLHTWSGGLSHDPMYTALPGVDWAFCTPVGRRGDERWGVYVTGQSHLTSVHSGGQDPKAQLESDVRFTELVASVINSVLTLGNLQASVAVLSQFLAPPIVAALERTSGDGSLDMSLLEPRECPVTVLFCDLRGFSHRAESEAHDLRGLLERVSQALQVMTRHVTDFGGVTGEFLGDATLGFWGWPFASEEAPLNACRAALAIRAAFDRFRDLPEHPLHDFEMGIGIAHGRAMAGKIGTQERMTVTVFGPVVNLASRLQNLTRQLHVPILLDEPIAELVRERMCRSEGRTRRLARLLPYGMETPLTVSELLPPEEGPQHLTDAQLQRYEEGVDHFIAGDWNAAYTCLHEMPAWDRAQDFLTLRIAQHGRTPPPDWDGVIRIVAK